MRAEDLNLWVRAVPFAPFRIRMNSGRTFDVRHPEMARVGRTHVFLFSFEGDMAEIHERVEMIGLVLIESVSPIEVGRPA